MRQNRPLTVTRQLVKFPAGEIRIVAYDVTGRQVKVLATGLANDLVGETVWFPPWTFRITTERHS